jgi:hypothetical protein
MIIDSVASNAEPMSWIEIRLAAALSIRAELSGIYDEVD